MVNQQFFASWRCLQWSEAPRSTLLLRHWAQLSFKVCAGKLQYSL